MAALKGRIARLRELGMMKASELKPEAREKPVSPERGFLPGWSRLASHVFTRVVESSLALGGLGPSGEPELFDPRHFEWEIESGGLRPLDELSFLDFETTGLSGGTGTIAFLAAVGRFEGPCFRVAQVFLDDFPGETDFLGEVLSLLEERPFLVTYNGKAFDYPLLKTRCVMNAIKIPQVSGHIDALHVTRRLWRRTLGPCSLKAMEESVLGLPRGEDIPGFLIPGIWLDYVSGKKAADGLMEAVIEHNATDVVSLARLFLRIRSILANPAGLALRERVDAARLARGLFAAGRSEEALGILEEAAAEGDQRSLRALARHYRRVGMLEAYGEAVARLDGESLEGRIEKAKYEEHVAGNPMAALVHVQAALSMDSPMSEKTLAGLRHREARLIRKLSRRDRA
jgi:uncharacterized protein YprB with RNaseH-like and TPR domain